MTQLLVFNVTNGLIIGTFYVLMALGLSLILNLSNVINFAHGGFLVVGGYIAYTITPSVGFWGGARRRRLHRLHDHALRRLLGRACPRAASHRGDRPRAGKDAGPSALRARPALQP